MNKLQVFENEEFGKVRALTIDNEPWFVGKDVAEILGYTNPSKALADHVDKEDKLNNEPLLSLGQRGGWLINESGLYSLIFSSKLPNAKRFKHWVTSEVLPAIRKTGSYQTQPKGKKLFEIKETISNNKTFLVTKVTGKGQQYFINKFLGGRKDERIVY